MKSLNAAFAASWSRCSLGLDVLVAGADLSKSSGGPVKWTPSKKWVKAYIFSHFDKIGPAPYARISAYNNVAFQFSIGYSQVHER